MRHGLWMMATVLVGCTEGGVTADTDPPTGTDTGRPEDTDDTDLLDTDIADTDDTDVADTDVSDIDETAIPIDTDPADTDASDTDDTDASDTDETGVPIDTGWPDHRGWCFGGAGRDTNDTALDSALTWFDTGIHAHERADGSVSDWQSRMATSADASAVFSTLGWTPRHLMVGLRDPALVPGRADLDLVIYLGGHDAEATVGLPGPTRTPALTVPATWAVRWATDGSTLALYQGDATGWRRVKAPAELRAVPTTDAPAVEVQIPFRLLGCDRATTATWMLVDRTTGATTSASPSESVVEGTDADVACAFTFNPSFQNAWAQLIHDCGQRRRGGIYRDTSVP